MSKYVTRRNVMVAGAAAAAGAVLLSRESDASGPRDPYFRELQAALLTAGVAGPTLVVDRDRLNRNIDTLIAAMPANVAHRVPSKSLPSHPLLNHVMARASTTRIMTFNWQMLLELSKTQPTVDQLIGKPLPVAAMRKYFELLPTSSSAAAKQVQWLVDTPERLAQYAAVAEGLGTRLRVNLEIDVGLHRGGFAIDESLRDVLRTIDNSERLTFAGFMGYEAHVPAMPEALGMRDRAEQYAFDTYRAALVMAESVTGGADREQWTRNAAGSPTFRLYEDDRIANDLTVGSALVKPTGFDTELLSIFEPACFIATPVLKTYSETTVPGLEFARGFQTFMDPNLDNSVYIYGGNWYAEPVDPPGLRVHPQMGQSSNQAMLTAGSKLELQPDDFVFLRPKASEAVFLQFGDIAVFEDGAIVDAWPVFSASA